MKLSEILLRESENPQFKNITITRVEPSPDMSTARVFYSTFIHEIDIEQLTKALNKAAGFFQKKLGHALTTRNTPKLTFQYDKGFDYAVEVDEILRKVKDKKS